MKRSYHQYCGVARGLDLVGDRWTLLVVRDLLLGPMRFTDLHDSLVGIGTNLLSARLRQMEAAGIVSRAVLPPPAGSSVYQLTERGQELEPVVMAIGAWGSQCLGDRRPDDVMSVRSYLLAMRALCRLEVDADRLDVFELRIEDQVFEVRAGGGRCVTRAGGADDASAVLAMDLETLDAILLGGLTAEDALERRPVSSFEDQSSLRRFVALFGPGRDPNRHRTAIRRPRGSD